MQESGPADDVIRFGVFEANRKTGELRKSGVRIHLQDQPFQILLMLLEHPGDVVTREEIQRRLWPDGTFVEFEHSIGTAIKKLRQALGDDADTPRYIETLPKRGFRFIASLESLPAVSPSPAGPRWPMLAVALGVAAVLVAIAWIYALRTRVPAPPERTLTRLTFDDGLQFGATWSPDGRYIAYSSNRGGKFDIWVQQVGGTNPVKITTRSGHNWQPDWSPDGSQIVFRSEGEGGGLFVVPALGGMERRVSSFGYRPKWSPDGRLILFGNTFIPRLWNDFYLVGLDGQPPRQVLAEFLEKQQFLVRSVAWHPDGRRVSVWGGTFWTLSPDGRDARKSGVADQVDSRLRDVHFGFGDFRWAPSGRAIYFEAESHRVTNLWRIDVEPSTLRWTALQRLTTGPGPDNGVSLSADGKKLAFTARNQRVRIWWLPFDLKTGRVLGKGEAVTPAGVDAWLPDISPDGRKLAFVVWRAGKWELWKKSLDDGRETLLSSTDDVPGELRWSPDSGRLIRSPWVPGAQPCLIQTDYSGQSIVSPDFDVICEDWSPDSQSVVAAHFIPREAGGPEDRLIVLPVSAAPHAEVKARIVTSSRTDGFGQMRISPDGKWIVFEAVKGGMLAGPAAEATLYVVPASGGSWIRITDDNFWNDKPRWSPDGRTIYYISSRTGFLNVWGIRFDPRSGHPVGVPFQVTSFENPELTVADDTSYLDLSLSSNRLVICLQQSSGSVWMLDNVDK